MRTTVSPRTMKPRLSVVTLVNDEALYAQASKSLARQHRPGTVQWIPIQADHYRWNAAQALNVGIERARADWVVCAHQDVIFPLGWWMNVSDQIRNWERRSVRPVAVAGLVGVRANGSFRGSVDDPHGFCRWGPLPAAVISVDEHVIIIRRLSELRFDPQTPGFHCYGADIALEARHRGLEAIAINAPVVHLSKGSIDAAWKQAAAWLLCKWGHRTHGVIPTCAAIIADQSVRTAPRRLLVHLNRRLGVYRRRFTMWRSPKAGSHPHDHGMFQAAA